ncbi:MAG: cold shock domain-containing protein [Acidobacteriota bacterium]
MEKLEGFRELEEALRATPREMPRGVVRRFDRSRGYGFIEGASGQRVFFYLPTLDFVGPLGAKELAVGTEVGYDVVLTTKGARASKIRIISTAKRT